MGLDKAFVEVGGRPMVVRVATALTDAGCSPVVCQGGNHQLTAAFGLEVVPDPIPDAGPVLAIMAALEHHGGPILVAACDLADLDQEAARALIERAGEDPAVLVAVATAETQAHLLSYWRPEALDPLRRLVADGVTAYRVALQRLGACEVPVAPTAVRNINRPEDLG